MAKRTRTRRSTAIPCRTVDMSSIDVRRRNANHRVRSLVHGAVRTFSFRSRRSRSSSISSESGVSRRVFEDEMLAWSKESEQLKRFVKQIQFENRKMKGIIEKLEEMAREYINDNERLKQDVRHLSLLRAPSPCTDNDADRSSDVDICLLTLKWLTYDVAQRTADQLRSSGEPADADERQAQDADRQVTSNVCVSSGVDFVRLGQTGSSAERTSETAARHAHQSFQTHSTGDEQSNRRNDRIEERNRKVQMRSAHVLPTFVSLLLSSMLKIAHERNS
jgi:hypothetical protein